MRLSTKSRYGLRAMFDMAYHSGTLPAQIKNISRRQNISPRYLEQIFQDLKRRPAEKPAWSARGYFLSRKPQDITVKEVLDAAEGNMNLVDCTRSGKGCKKVCDFDNQCVTQQVWNEASKRLNDYLASITLKDLCDQGKVMGMEKELDHRFMYFI